jgi:hypothetical protein
VWLDALRPQAERYKRQAAFGNGGRFFNALEARRKLASYEVAGMNEQKIIRPARDDGK